MDLFAPRKEVHFALDSYHDDQDDGNDQDSNSSSGILTTARSSPAPATSPIPPSPPPRDSLSYYPPLPIKSNTSSREAAFDLDDDDDEFDDDRQVGDQPLLEGLLHSGARRASLDARRGTNGAKAGDEEDQSGTEDTNHSDLEPIPEWLRKGAGVMAGIANMSNSILGAGIVGLPYALREAGFAMGILLLLLLGIVTDWTIRLIVLNAKMSGRRTYIDIMDTCFGPRGRAAVSFFQFTFAFGGMCAFCVILGDTIPRVLQSVLPSDPGAFLSFLSSRQFVVIVLTVGVSFPLSLYRDIEKLSKASALALVSMVFIVIAVGLRGPGVEDELKGDPSERWTFIQPGFFEAIGVISFAFVCHHNSLLIYGSLRVPTLDRFAQVTHVSTALSVIACLCMSVSGFLVFTSRTPGNILNAFAEDDFIINIARALFGCNMFATLPLEAFVCREVLETYYWPEQEYVPRRHVVITSALVLGSLLISLMTHNLGLVLELAGGFSATALAYIFPAGCYLVLTTPTPGSHTNRNTRIQRLAAWACAGFGLVVMVLSTVLSIRKALTKNSTPGAVELGAM